MSRLLYFAYGSNLDADQMRERCPGGLVRFRARLQAYQLGFTHYSARWRGGAGGLHRAITYSVRIKQDYAPSAVYLEKMIRWAHHWRFPSSYLEWLQRVTPGRPQP